MRLFKVLWCNLSVGPADQRKSLYPDTEDEPSTCTFLNWYMNQFEGEKKKKI